MSFYLVLGIIAFLGVLWLARWFVTAPAPDLARAFRLFVATFSALASTGLIFFGRFGLALITLIAMAAALRSLKHASAGVGSFGGPQSGEQASRVETDTLLMTLDHATGELEGEVKNGPYQGRTLDSLGQKELFDLLDHCLRDDPRSVPLLETYLDRRDPDWRAQAGGDQTGPKDSAAMDDAQAFAILGLEPGADEETIKSAHRRLMTRLHPDHGGSTALAAQINRAKDQLLHGRR